MADKRFTLPMNRNITNTIRFLLDECLPPIIRDNKWFMYPFYLIGYRGRNVHQAMNFKRSVAHMSPDEYVAFYTSIQTISLHRETDLNRQCLRAVIERVANYQIHSILDAGCGNGYLTRLIADSNPACRVVGFDQQTPRSTIPDNFYIGSMHELPFADNEFDVVICAHVLEHCLNLDQAISELKRVCKTELIIVVPKQRPYFYTVDEHINFFYYEELLTTAVGLKNFTCKNLRGDWFYSGLIPTE